jgi:hypothetical protein
MFFYGIMIGSMAKTKVKGNNRMGGNPNPTNNTGKTYKTVKPNFKAQMFATFYLSPTSDTFMNIRQSAMRAGYTETYADNITVQKPKWWIELTQSSDFTRAQILNKAQSRIKERLDDATNGDKDLLKIQTDVAKFALERLGKDHYSTRQEVTGADGRRLFDNKTRESATVPIANLFKGVAKDA